MADESGPIQLDVQASGKQSIDAVKASLDQLNASMYKLSQQGSATEKLAKDFAAMNGNIRRGGMATSNAFNEFSKGIQTPLNEIERQMQRIGGGKTGIASAIGTLTSGIATGATKTVAAINNFARQQNAALDAAVAAAASRTAMLDNLYRKAKPVVRTATAYADGAYSPIGGGAVRGGTASGSPLSKVVPPPQDVAKTSGLMRALGDDMGYAHSAARGLASGFGLLWLTWGRMVPLLTGAAISHATSQMVRLGSEVDNTMTTIKVLSQESEASIVSLKEQMLELARTGPYGPKEIADAMKTLSLAGMSAGEVMGSVKDVLNFAVAGDTSISEAADVLTSVGTAFKMSALSYGVVGDVIAKTAAVSKSSVDSLGKAFKTASVINSQYGVTLQDTALSLAALSNVGIQGTAAGTALRNFYADLAARGDKAKFALKALGVEARSSSGEMRGMVEILSDISQKFDEKQFSGRGRASWMEAVFGERGGKVAFENLQMLQTAAKDAGGNITDMLRKMQADIADNAAFSIKAAAEMSLTPLNQMKSVKATLDAALVESFEKLSPIVLDVSAKLKEMFNSEQFKSGLVAIGQAVGAITVALVEHGATIVTLLGGYAALRATMMAMSSVRGLAVWFMDLSAAATASKVALATTAAASGSVAVAVPAATAAVGALSGAFYGLAAKVAAGASVVARFLGPIGLVLGVGYSAWELYKSMSTEAMDRAKDLASGNKANSLLEYYTKERDRILEINEALIRNMSIEDMRALKSVQKQAAEVESADAAALAKVTDPLARATLVAHQAKYKSELDTRIAQVKQAREFTAQFEEENRAKAKRNLTGGVDFEGKPSKEGVQLDQSITSLREYMKAKRETALEELELNRELTDSRKFAIEAEKKIATLAQKAKDAGKPIAAGKLAELRAEAALTEQDIRLSDEATFRRKAQKEGLELLAKAYETADEALRGYLLTSKEEKDRIALEVAQQDMSAAEVKKVQGLKKLADEYNKTLGKLYTGEGDDQRLDPARASVALSAYERSVQAFVDNYNREMARMADPAQGIKDGLKDFRESTKNVSGDFRNLMGSAFKSAEDDFLQLMKTGESGFGKLFSVIEDGLLRIAIRQSLLKPMEQMMSGFNIFSVFGGSSGVSSSMAEPADYGQYFANGAAFRSPSLSALSGSVLTKPTNFRFADGAAFGQAGELGYEAVMPLKRTKGGKLGVEVSGGSGGGQTNVVVQVIESPGNGGKQERRTEGGVEFLSIFVESVKGAIASDIRSGSGQIPAAMQSSYGLNRGAGALR